MHFVRTPQGIIHQPFTSIDLVMSDWTNLTLLNQSSQGGAYVADNQ